MVCIKTVAMLPLSSGWYSQHILHNRIFALIDNFLLHFFITIISTWFKLLRSESFKFFPHLPSYWHWHQSLPYPQTRPKAKVNMEWINCEYYWHMFNVSDISRILLIFSYLVSILGLSPSRGEYYSMLNGMSRMLMVSHYRNLRSPSPDTVTDQSIYHIGTQSPDPNL